MATNQSRTLSQLATAVASLGFPDPDGLTNNAYINEEYKAIAAERRWEWLQGTFTFPITSGTFAYTLSTVGPGDIRNLDALWVADASGTQYTVRYVEPLRLLDLKQDHATTTIGPPEYWSVWGGQVLLYPTPDQGYTATVAYAKSLGDIPLVNPSDRPLMPGDYDQALVWGAASMGAMRMKDWLGRDFAGQQRDRVLALMRSDYQLKQRQNADEVEVTGIWSHGRSYPLGW